MHDKSQRGGGGSEKQNWRKNASSAVRVREKEFHCLRRPNKCQKRPTTEAKETYYVRTFESLPRLKPMHAGESAGSCRI